MCGISNALDGSQNDFIRCAKELPEMSIAYGHEENADSESESEDPFDSADDCETESIDDTLDDNQILHTSFMTL